MTSALPLLESGNIAVYGKLVDFFQDCQVKELPFMQKGRLNLTVWRGNSLPPTEPLVVDKFGSHLLSLYCVILIIFFFSSLSV